MSGFYAPQPSRISRDEPEELVINPAHAGL